MHKLIVSLILTTFMFSAYAQFGKFTYTQHGAIAIDLNGKGAGIVVTSYGRAGNGGAAMAEKEALRSCKKQAGWRGSCRLLSVFVNSCSTVAIVPEDWSNKDAKKIFSAGKGRNEKEAVVNALALCNERAANAGITEKEPCSIWVEPMCAVK